MEPDEPLFFLEPPESMWPEDILADANELIRLAHAGELTNSEFYRIAGLVMTDYGIVMQRDLWRPVEIEPGRWSTPDPARTVARRSLRSRFNRLASFAVFTVEYMDSLAKLLAGKQVHEVCARTGILQAPMRARGVDWSCSDLRPKAEHVEALDAMEAVERHKPDVVFASWVTIGSDLDQRLAAKLPTVQVVESCTGTADEGFFSNERYTTSNMPEGLQDVARFDMISDRTILTVPVGVDFEWSVSPSAGGRCA